MIRRTRRALTCAICTRYSLRVNTWTCLSRLADEIREWSNSVNQFMIDYLAGLRDRPVYSQTSSREIRSGLDSKLPIKGTDLDSLLKVFRETIVPFSRQNAHPRMFGYVQSPGTPIGAFADLLASTLNANLTIWRSAPAPVEVERVTID